MKLFLYNLFMIGATVSVLSVVIGLIKPKFFEKILKKFATRRHILVSGVLLFFILGSLGAAAEPASVKQAREERQRIAAEQKTKEENEKRAKEESAKKAKLQAEEAERNKITTKEKTEKEEVPFGEESRNDSTLAKGSTKVLQEGSKGEISRTYTYTYKGGKEQSKVLKEEKVSKPPVNKVTLVGTYVYVPPKAVPAPKAVVAPPSSGGAVKLSKNGICHTPGTTYYNQTTNFTGFPSLQACLNAGGRMPKR